MDKLSVSRRDFLKLAAAGLGALSGLPEALEKATEGTGSFFTKEDLKKVGYVTDYEDNEARLIHFFIPPEKEGVEFTQFKDLLKLDSKDYELAEVYLLLEKGGDETESMLITFPSDHVYVIHNSRKHPIDIQPIGKSLNYDAFQCDLLKGGNFVLGTYKQGEPEESKFSYFKAKPGLGFEEIYTTYPGQKKPNPQMPGLNRSGQVSMNKKIDFWYKTNDMKLAKFSKGGNEVSVECFGYDNSMFVLDDLDMLTTNSNNPLIFTGKGFICYPKRNPLPTDSKHTVDFVFLTDKRDETIITLNTVPAKIHYLARDDDKIIPLSLISDTTKLDIYKGYKPFSEGTALVGVVAYNDYENGETLPWIFVGKNTDGFKLFEHPQTVEMINNLNIPETYPYKPIRNV